MDGVTPEQEVGERWAQAVHRLLPDIPHLVYVFAGPPWQVLATRGTWRESEMPVGPVRGEEVRRVRTAQAQHWQYAAVSGLVVGLALAPDRGGPWVEPFVRLSGDVLRLMWNRTQQQFLAQAMAHEIRNPLTLLQGYAEILMLRGDRELAEKMSAEVERMTERLNTFLDAGRPLATAAIDLAAVAERVLQSYQAWADRQGVRVERDLVPTPVRGDAQALEMVLGNLVRNALESMPDGGRLAVVAQPHDGGGEVVVRDTGPGIARDVAVSLFRPYYSTKPGGHGLGLALAWDVAVRHGGRLELLPGTAGAAFRLWVPAAGLAEPAMDG
jgi:signal transduction histidine kinase